MDTTIEKFKTALAKRYEVQIELRRGGMATVYLARDLKHERSVAIKVLRPDLAHPVVAERFLQEIRFLAGLTHPNILALHDSGHVGGIPYYVMPYVEGESLRDLLKRETNLSLQKVLRIATETAEALDHAHRHGVLHRDVKPANILLSSGHAQLADFGIAKALSEAQDATLTGAGISVGTPAYMSPEQARGSNVDERSDIYSLGCVVYEMLVGRPPFAGNNVEELIRQHLLERPPPLTRTRSGLPDSVQRAVHKALEKDPSVRFERATLFADALRTSDGAVAPHRRTWRSGFLAGAALGAGLLFFAAWRAAREPATSPLAQSAHEQLSFTGNAWWPAISPDGEFVAYVEKSGDGQRLLLRERGRQRTVELLQAKTLYNPTWSPNGSEIAVTARAPDVHSVEIVIVSRLGGERRRVGPGFHSAWSPDGTKVAIAYVSSKGFTIYDVSTGRSERIDVEGFRWLVGMDWSRATAQFALVTTLENGTYAAWTVERDGQGARIRFEDKRAMFGPRFSPDGNALYVLRADDDSKDLLKIALNDDAPTTLLRGLQAGETFNVTSAGDLLYTRLLEFSNLWTCAPSDSAPAEARQITRGTRALQSPSVSPTGEWVAFTVGRTTANVYRRSLQTGAEEQLTFLEGRCASPAWSPRGESIAFGYQHQGTSKIGIVRANGGGLTWHDVDISPDALEVTWLGDSTLLYQRPGNADFHFLDLKTGKERPLVQKPTPGWLFDPIPSPRGDRLAVMWNRFTRDESRRRVPGIWLIHPADSVEKFVTSGQWLPMAWSPDERWIFANVRDSGEVFRIPLTGEEPELMLSLPGVIADTGFIPPNQPLVFGVHESVSDIWITEGFDPN